MQRRELLRLLGGVPIIAGLAPDELLALGRVTHHQLAGEPSSLGFFTIHEMHTVAAAGERIIPATDTPGAMAAACHRFTERIVAHHYPAERQQRFRHGLIDLDQLAANQHGRLFIEADSTAQDAVLAAVEAAAYAARTGGADSFWRDLKQLTLFGYYTSEIGIEEELHTNRFPGRFDGAMPIAEAPR